MPERTHLSIREVLDLLVVEFPDVTISKIRFLESRGLIHPERTPSGYRRFYDEDVERLRWILRQQREHFLPLRVIKGRLDQNGTEVEPPLAPSLFEPTGEGDASERDADPVLVHATARNGSPELVTAGARSESAPGLSHVAVPVAQLSGAAGALGARPPAPSARGALPHSEQPPATSMSPEGGAHSARARSRARANEAVTTSPPVESAAPSPAEPPRSRHAATEEAPLPAGDQPTGADERPSPTRRAPSRGVPGSTRGPRRESSATRGALAADLASGVSLTAEELAHAAGIELDVVVELLDYGLIEGRTIAGVTVYDEDELVVARLAGACRRFGIESRHLRSFKHAAEREAGLFAQIVTPLLRQRNPESRDRALADLSELADLGGKLRDAFLREELRGLTGG